MIFVNMPTNICVSSRTVKTCCRIYFLAGSGVSLGLAWLKPNRSVEKFREVRPNLLLFSIFPDI